MSDSGDDEDDDDELVGEDAELKMVEQQARQEWEQAGYEPGAFSMDAYNDKFLSEEMGNQDKEWRLNDIAGVSNLEEKRAIIQESMDRKLTKEKVMAVVTGFAQDRAADLLNIGIEVSSIFEPGFMRRARQRRRHLARIEVSEAEASRVVMERTEAQQRRKQWSRLERQAKQMRDERVANKGPSAKIASDVAGTAEVERRTNEIQMFKERNLAVLEQKNEEALARKERWDRAQEKKDGDLRAWREGYWAENSASAAEEAEMMIEVAAEDRVRRELELVAMDDAELAERDMQRNFDQVSGANISDDPSGLGVFGIPWENGAEVRHETNRLAGVDDAEVKLFSATPQTEYEERVVQLQELEAEEGRQADLYESLTRETAAVDKELAGLGLLKHRVEQEVKQLEEDFKLLTQTMFGPPRREPAAHQIEANHARKNRIKELKTRLSQIDKRSQDLRVSKATAQSQSIEVAKKVALARDKVIDVHDDN